MKKFLTIALLVSSFSTFADGTFGQKRVIEIEILGSTSEWTIDGTPYEDTYSYYCTRDLVNALSSHFSLDEATDVFENVNCATGSGYVQGVTDEELKASLQESLRNDIAEMLKTLAKKQ